jgi:hypothetical protein
MRALLMAVIAIVLLSLVGWITFNVASDRASVNIETDKIEADMEDMKNAGEELLDNTSRAIDRATTDDDDTVEIDTVEIDTVDRESVDSETTDNPVDVDAVDDNGTTSGDFEPIGATAE